jgi:CRISPR-associated protein Csm1
MMGDEFNTIVLAALLHDVGKLLQRGRSLLFDIKGRHPEVSARFVAAFQRAFSDYAEPSLLQTLVLHHHRTIRGTRPDDISDPRQRTLAFLINKADGLSASERGQRARGGRDYKTTPLAPVFERVALTAKRRDEPRTRYHPKPLTSPRSMDYGLFPGSFTRYAPGELEELLLEFGRASYPVLQRADFASFDSLVLYLLNLLQTYAWPVPSDTQSLVPDVSLFDHLRSTAAIAGCLYLFYDAKGTLNEGSLKDTDKEAFLLAAGDLSGIQSYIFDIATGDEVGGGVARRLRARSLFVQLLSTVVSHHVLRRLRLPPTHLLMASGGKFYLLLPNLSETVDMLEETRREADTWCLEVLRGEVAVNLAWVPFNEAQLRSTAKGGEGFGAVMQKATAALAILKEQKLCFGLVSGNRWNEEEFILSGFDGGDVCPSCGKFPRLLDEELCKQCGLDQRWGARLPRAKYIAITPASSSGELDILGYGVSLCECAGDVPADASLVLAINNPGAPSVKGAPTSSYHLVTQVPTEERERESVALT